jgi:apolipoprotein N-acyltransferase
VVLDTPHGRIAGAIGFDADFPALIREAGESRADILIVPSADWKAIDPLHTRMAMVRGIENGCAVVRQTSNGLSAAVDSRGRTLAAVDFVESGPRVMVTQVPRHGERTLYARLGDVFAWGCLMALALYVGLALRSPRPGPAAVAH